MQIIEAVVLEQLIFVSKTCVWEFIALWLFFTSLVFCFFCTNLIFSWVFCFCLSFSKFYPLHWKLRLQIKDQGLTFNTKKSFYSSFYRFSIVGIVFPHFLLKFSSIFNCQNLQKRNKEQQTTNPDRKQIQKSRKRQKTRILNQRSWIRPEDPANSRFIGLKMAMLARTLGRTLHQVLNSGHRIPQLHISSDHFRFSFFFFF